MAVPTIIHIVGNRPQFIKLAVLHDAIAKKTEYKQIIIHTGQHSSHEMSDVFFEELSIPKPDICLNLSGYHGAGFIGKAASDIAQIPALPDDSLVMVYGDTNSTLAGALAAAENGKKLLHFESGVRTASKTMPEEINRVLTDRISNVHYCCTTLNQENLQREGYGTAIPSEVVLTGDLMLDAFERIPVSGDRIGTSDYIACTIHRAENISHPDKLKEIATALNWIHRSHEVVIPLHPHTKQQLQRFGITLDCTVLPPLGYRQMKRLLYDSDFVITDSGGACREAFFSARKSLIIMDSPFWPEIIQAGAALHCEAESQKIIDRIAALETMKPSFDSGIFGKGDAAGKIVNHLKSLPAEG